MRQVDEAELIVIVRYHMGRWPAGLRQQLASRHAEARNQAEQILAVNLVREALSRYEVLSNGPEPLRDLFSRAAYLDGRQRGPTIEKK